MTSEDDFSILKSENHGWMMERWKRTSKEVGVSEFQQTSSALSLLIGVFKVLFWNRHGVCRKKLGKLPILMVSWVEEKWPVKHVPMQRFFLRKKSV